MFSGHEAVKHMPTIPPKFTDKEKIGIKDPVALEIEAEVDRKTLCEKIVEKMQQQQMVPALEQQASSIKAMAKTDDKAIKNAKDKARVATPLTPINEALASDGFSKHGTVHNFYGINIVTYTCDFGNIIIGKTSQRSFRLTNCGKIPISFNFDKKLLNNASIAIEPDKAQKVMPNQSVLFKAIMTSRKN